MRLLKISLSLLLASAAFSARAAQPAATDALDELRAAGVQKLQEALTQREAVVPAARLLALAATGYETAGKADALAEINACLYWCAKRLSPQEIAQFTQGAQSAVADRLTTLLRQPPQTEDGPAELSRVENFARAHAADPLLVAVQYFELADRCQGTPSSLTALERSLDAFQEAVHAPAVAAKVAPVPSSPAVPAPLPVPPQNVVVPEPVSALPPVPDRQAIAAAEKKIHEILHDDYAHILPDLKAPLAAKLLGVARDTNDDPPAKYVLLRDARDFALAGGDTATALGAIDTLTTTFALNAFEEKVAALRMLVESAHTNEAHTALAETLSQLLADTTKAGQFEKLGALLPLADQAATRHAVSGQAGATLKTRLAAASTVYSQWTTYTQAAKTLINQPADTASNLAAGTFLCLVKADWAQGLPLLGKGSDALGALVAADQAVGATPTPTDQTARGDAWWDFAGKQNVATLGEIARRRSQFWYQLAEGGGLSGLLKMKVETRLAVLTSKPAEGGGGGKAPLFEQEIEAAAERALGDVYKEYLTAYTSRYSEYLRDEPKVRAACNLFDHGWAHFDQAKYDAFKRAYERDKAKLIDPLWEKFTAAKTQYLQPYLEMLRHGTEEEQKAYYVVIKILREKYPEGGNKPIAPAK